MKRIVLMMSLAGTVLLASCVQQMPDPEVGRTATVSVGVGLSEMSTRAYADGTTATHLQYAVYEVNDDGIENVGLRTTGTTGIVGDPYEGTKEMINLKTQLSFSLLTGHTYVIVFWADAYGKYAENAPYTVDFAEKGATMEVDYLKVKANDENLDAFYAYKEITVNGDGSVSVQLSRPFAQINIGTNDFEQAKALGDAPTFSYVKVPTYTTLDLTTGEVSGKATTPATYNAIPGQAEDVVAEEYPVEGYDYLAMAYVLVDESETIEVAFGWAVSDQASSGKERTVGSVPVRPNYRTNIYGSILTGSLDLNVEIVPGVGGENNFMLDWDGKTYTQPAFDKGTGTYTVNGADELAWLARESQNSDTTFEGQTIMLQSDLNLGGLAFPAFAAGATRSGSNAVGSAFKGVFDGNGKTISNAKVVVKDATADHAVGFFASLAGKDAAVKNVMFEDIEIVNETADQAGVVGIITEGATVENVKVMGGTIKSKEAAGGIVGRILKSGTVKDCENHANVSTTAHNAGGIVGAAYYDNEGMTITDCDNYGNISGKFAVGGIVGLSCGEVTNCNNYGKSVTGEAASVGGIVGEQKGSGSITGCTNQADVSGGEGSTNNYGCGGIVGWVRYTTEAAYTNQSAIVVSGCTNEGKHIVGAAGVGGIVGVWYSDGECKENINMAETITASGSFAAGIVGNSQWTEVDSEGGGKDAHVEGLQLTVHDNVSYTAENDIKAKDCTHLYVYINDSSRTTENNNTNPSMTTVGSDEELTAALTTATEGAYIKLTEGNYAPFGYNQKNPFTTENVTIDCGGAVFTGGESYLQFNETTTVKNAHFKNYDVHHTGSGGTGAYAVYGYTCGNFEDCIFEGEAALRSATITGNTTFKNCQFIATDEYAFHVDACTGTPAITLIDCTMSGYCPLGSSNVTKYEIIGCTFSTNDAGFGGVGLRRPSTLTNCKFYIGGNFDHDEIALKYADISYVFNRCTVNDQALSADYAFAVGEENIKVTIDGVETPLVKTGDKDKRP